MPHPPTLKSRKLPSLMVWVMDNELNTGILGNDISFDFLLFVELYSRYYRSLRFRAKRVSFIFPELQL